MRYLLLLLGVVAIATLSTLSFRSASVPAFPESTFSESTFSAPASTSVQLATDAIAHPPLRQVFTLNDYQLVITAADQWKTPAAIAQLYQGDVLQWEKPLPQQYGPRFVVLGTAGQVLLLDEFINVASSYALLLWDSAGEPVAQYSFDEVVSAIARTSAEVTAQATSGWWITAEPQLQEAEGSADGHVLVQTGGTVLTVDLSTGDLSTGDPYTGD